MRKSIILLLLALIIVSCSTTKKEEGVQQTIKKAVLKTDSVFEDNIDIPFDDKGVQLTVHMSYDEVENQLFLSLSANRKLFVFRNDTKYKRVFKHPLFSKRTLLPERLDFPVLVQPNTTYCLPSAVYNTFSKKRKEHLFNKWLENVSPRLKPVSPSPTGTNSVDAAMVYDSIVQRFDVDPSAKRVSLSIRNILVVDPDEKNTAKAGKQKKQRYNFVCDRDLKLTYLIDLQRDPCYESAEILDSVNAAVSEIKRAFKNLQSACPDGKAASKEEAGIFRQHKEYLLSRYPKTLQVHECPDVRDAINTFNKYVDSIRTAPCTYTPELVKADKGPASLGCRPDMLLAAAHTIDNCVAKIMASHDQIEIRDLKSAARDAIRTTNNNIKERGIVNDEQRKALAAFRRAEEYFRTSVGN